MVGYNEKQNRMVIDLRWKKRGRIVLLDGHRYYQITASPRHLDEEQQQKGEMRFLKKKFCIFLTLWLSYSTYSIITGSGTQQVIFMEKFCLSRYFM